MSKSLKVVSVIAALFILLSAFATPAFAGGDEATNMIFIEAYYSTNKGPVFVFHVNGVVANLNEASFAGFDNVYCVQVDAETVKCTTPKKSAGLSGLLRVGKFGFWVKAPAARANYCYTVYDWVYFEFGLNAANDGTVEAGVFEPAWEAIGVYCQGTEAQLGDWIEFYNPSWEDWFTYDFLLDGLECFDAGPAYYYPWCTLD